jgi:response regulator RpfG family c-di-GMP phosphodiesterase
MFTFRSARTISAKLRRLVVLSVGLALLILACLGLVQETRRYIEGKRETLLATAHVFSAAVSPAVAARDRMGVLRAFRAIGSVPGLVYAEVEDASGASLGHLGQAVRLAGDLDLTGTNGVTLALLSSRTVQVAVPVVNEGQGVGRLVIVADTEDLLPRFAALLVLATLGAVLAAGVALAVAMRLQASITKPLAVLRQTMATIKATRDCSANVNVSGDEDVGALADSFNAMMQDIRTATDEIVDREEEVIFRLSRATERRDGDTGEHILRMATLCRLIAEGMGLRPEQADAIYRAAPLHDVGKIGVPDAIMLKRGPLSPAERREIEKHTLYGYEILRDSKSQLIQLAAEIALTHHERWDGTGYPRQLSGYNIPLPGRIAAVADVCDALVSARAYKQGWSLDEVRLHLVENAGKLFDLACVNGVLSRWSDVKRLYAAPAKEAHRSTATAA